MYMFLKLFLIGLPVFVALDLLWLGVVARGFYVSQLGHLMRTDVNWGAAIVFYGIFILGLSLFVLLPAIEKSSLTHAVVFGALFGLVTYATYDLTNLATLKDWPVLMTVVDIIWGSLLGAAVSSTAFLVVTKVL